MAIEDVLTSAAAGGMSTGSPWGAVGAGVLNYMGTQSTNEANADIAASNNAWSANQYASRYQTMVNDLKAAGLNPMLAYSQSPGSAPSAQQVQFQNPMSSAVQGFTDVLGTRAKAMSDVSSANKGYAEQENIDQQTKKLKALYDAGEPKALVEALVQAANKDKQAGLSYQAQVNHLNALIDNLAVRTNMDRADYNAMKETGFVGRVARELKPISDIGSDWLGLKGMFSRDKSASAGRDADRASREREGAANRASRERSRSYEERGTSYDAEGNVTGGYSRQRN